MHYFSSIRIGKLSSPAMFRRYATDGTESSLKDAEDVYKIGVRRCTRALEKLKNKQREFKQRVASSATLKDQTERPRIKVTSVGHSAAHSPASC